MNCIQLHGRITADCETRSVGDTTVTNFSIAVDRSYQKPGEEKKTDFFNCQAWGKRGETIGKFFHKGSEIVVSGEMQSRKYEDREGNNRIAWEVYVSGFDFCGSKSDNASYSAPAATTTSPDVNPGAGFDAVDTEGTEDELPF